MRISDWSSDVCSSDLLVGIDEMIDQPRLLGVDAPAAKSLEIDLLADRHRDEARARHRHDRALLHHREVRAAAEPGRRSERGVERGRRPGRSEEHTSELQSLMRISSAVFCLKKKTN